MNIRRVKADDTEEIVALWRDVFPEYNDPTRDPSGAARRPNRPPPNYWKFSAPTRLRNPRPAD
jgi:hypothetical protein